MTNPTEASAGELLPWKQYRRTGLSEMRPYVPGEDHSKFSINPVDTPELGGMVARNPKNYADQWYVAKAYFEENLEEVNTRATPASKEGAEIDLHREVLEWLKYLKRFLPSHGSFGCEGHDRHDHLIERLERTPADTREADAGGWRPIATAPKTSRFILVYCKDRKNTYVVYWTNKWKHAGGHEVLSQEPTHWMPLPKPPTE